MGFWTEVKSKIKSAIDLVQKDPILDTFAVSALESIPVVGGLFVRMYENSKDSPEDKTKQILILLQKMENMQEEKLENFCRNLEQNKILILENQNYLKEISTDTSIILNKLDQAQKERNNIVNDVQKVQNTLEKLYEKIEKLELQEDIKTHTQNASSENSYQDPDFRISWPVGWEQVSRKEILESAKRIDDSTAQELNLDEISQEAFVLRKKIDNLNQPNINIVKDEPTIDIEEYLDAHKTFYEKTLGWRVVKINYDKTIGIGTLEAELSPFGIQTFTIQKFYFRKNYTLLLTITQLTQDQLDKDPDYATEITEILQSLVFLT